MPRTKKAKATPAAETTPEDAPAITPAAGEPPASVTNSDHPDRPGGIASRIAAQERPPAEPERPRLPDVREQKEVLISSGPDAAKLRLLRSSRFNQMQIA